MKSILEYLWKQAFGDTGFADDKMEQAIKGKTDITVRHLATFRQIRDYGNGVTHENVWDARMEDIIKIKGKYDQLVENSFSNKKAPKLTLCLTIFLKGNGGSDRD